MLSVEEALARILASPTPMGEEHAALHDAVGRVLAADVVSPVDVPPFANSAMDGYAVRAADTADGEVVLRLNEVIAAGSVGRVRVEAGTASAIMTGAPMPDGADAVVMVEDTDGSRDGEVRVRRRAAPGQHVRPRGDDVVAGRTVLRAGRTLTPGCVGLASSLGLPTLAVRRRPVVAVLVTGDEVVLPGNPLAPGQIWSSNNFALCGMARDAGAVAVDHGFAPDDLPSLLARLRAVAESGADAVVTTGGVSVGAFDLVKEAMAAAGAEMDFWKVRMKPGKPLAFGQVVVGDRTVPVFGLPGNPVSCMVNFLQFVRPWLRIALGDPRPFLPVVEATLATAVSTRPGRAQLERVRLESIDGALVAHPVTNQSSGVLTSMVTGHGLMLLGAEVASVAAGSRVRVQLFDTSFFAGAEPGYGW